MQSLKDMEMTINYNNNYSDEDMYSKYPTELNKYECQKGPFEGFFVSSVEFCKLSKSPIVDMIT